MNKTIKLLFLAILNILVINISIFPGNNTLNCSVRLKAGTIAYTITYTDGKKAWADYIKKMTEGYLRAAEDYLAIPFPGKSGFTISGREEVYLHLKGSSLDGVRVGGYNLGHEVAVEYGISPIGNPALLFHELGHYWFPDGDQKWLLEGIVSYLPLVMAESGIRKLDQEEYSKIQAHWGLRYTVYSKDIPLKDDFRGKDDTERSFFYMKTFKLQYLMHREMGTAEYKDFLKEYCLKIKECSDAELLALLKKQKNINWQSFLSGWVFPGRYTAIGYDDFRDPDCDGLLSIDEYYIKTNPEKVDTDSDLIPDNAELTLNLDPLKPSGKRERENIINKYGPFIDGEGSDWQILPCVTIKERGDDAKRLEYNFLFMSYAFRGGNLCLYIETEKSPVPGKNIMFDVLVDLDFDGKTEKEYAFSLENPSTRWTYLYSTGTSGGAEGFQGALNSGFEVSIPAKSIGSDTFSILPIVRDWEKGVNFDEWDRWILIDIDTLIKVDFHALKTDLGKADADKDGIPDSAELSHHLDPAKPDPPQSIKKYGPFIDGMNSEWKHMNAETGSDKTSDAAHGEYDLVKMYYMVKDSFFYIMVQTRKKPGNTGNIMFDVLVDSDLDNQYDLDFAFFLSAPENPWNYVAAQGKSRFPEGLISAMDEVVEMAIPVTAIGKGDFQILPIIRDDVKKINYDEWGSWVRVKVR